MENEELQTLIERVRQRDAVALAAYLEYRRASLLRFIEQRLGAALRGRVEAQDILQDLTLKALSGLKQADLTGPDPFAWLCHLAGQCIIDRQRHDTAGKRNSAREQAGNGDGSRDLIALLAASLTTPSQAVARDERHVQLEAALAALPVEHREVLRLRYAEDLPTKEIARRIGKTDVATRVLLTRLVQRLQDLLGPDAAP